MKLILAIINNDDDTETLEELNKKHIFVTHLSTTGGFFKKKNSTLLIGIKDEELETVLSILKKSAGVRKTIKYTSPSMPAGGACTGANTAIPMDMEIGGCTVFVTTLEDFEKF